MKQDEKEFLLQIFMRYSEEVTPRDIINEVGDSLPHKRAWFFLQKWSERGLYEYGVTLDLGWLTDAGKTLAMELYERNNL